MARMVIDGYGQLELNQVAFRRDGRIEAQCALDATDFATDPAENGMLLCVDNATRTIKLFKTGSDLPIALNYTAEHMYDDRANALKDFKLSIKDGFYPRLGYLAVGDKFTTNCISGVAADFKAGSHGTVNTDGSILVANADSSVPFASVAGIDLKVIKVTTMPDGQFALKFQVLSC